MRSERYFCSARRDSAEAQCMMSRYSTMSSSSLTAVTPLLPLSVRERYVKMREQPNRMADLDSRIENFDRALSHPNAEDLENLKKNVLQ